MMSKTKCYIMSNVGQLKMYKCCVISVQLNFDRANIVFANHLLITFNMIFNTEPNQL